MESKIVKADKKDFYRALLTDTLPKETPIIFSNDGLYKHLSKNASKNYQGNHLLNILETKCKETQPYVYTINKGSRSYRKLSLIHPASQNNYAKFYNNYSDIILYYCKQSKSSLRSPQKVSNSFYIRKYSNSLNAYRTQTVDTLREDLLVKYSNSYFAYRGHNLIYKFFKSFEFVNLEKKFSFLCMMDISKCFDSIYTHSIGWATKNKDFSKEFKSNNEFSNNFDSVIQKSNFNETNGIPIGPEFSRVFAEIILNGVDNKAIEILSDHSIYHEKDYTLRRYVDDYFIFTKDSDTLTYVKGVLEQVLSKYKLSINNEKTEVLQRPFFTKKSSAMIAVSQSINEFLSKFTNSREEIIESLAIESDSIQPLPAYLRSPLYPTSIRDYSRLYLNFIHSIQAICTNFDLKYSDVSNFIISSLFARSVSIIESFDDKSITISDSKYRLSLEIIIEAAFFFYMQSPTVSASFSLSKIMIISSRFAKKQIPDHSDSLNQFIYNQSISMLKFSYIDLPKYVENHLSLEKINILLALRELGDETLLPSDFIEEHLVNRKLDMTYFEIISILYYIRDISQYDSLKSKVKFSIEKHLAGFSQIISKSEAAHIFLDSLSCPYLERPFRRQLLKGFYDKYGERSEANIDRDLTFFEKEYWFVNWNNLDIYNVIEKKELQTGY